MKIINYDFIEFKSEYIQVEKSFGIYLNDEFKGNLYKFGNGDWIFSCYKETINIPIQLIKEISIFHETIQIKR